MIDHLFPTFGDVLAAVALAAFVSGMLYVLVSTIRAEEAERRAELRRRSTPPPTRPSSSVRVLTDDDRYAVARRTRQEPGTDSGLLSMTHTDQRSPRP